jgi:hypothetical protein
MFQGMKNQIELASAHAAPKLWEKGSGALRDLHDENLRIDEIIEAEFESIDEEE